MPEAEGEVGTVLTEHSTQTKVLSVCVASVAFVVLVIYCIRSVHKRRLEQRGCLPCQKTQRALFDSEITCVYSRWGWKLYVTGFTGAGESEHDTHDHESLKKTWKAAGVRRVVNLAAGDANGDEHMPPMKKVMLEMNPPIHVRYCMPRLKNVYLNDDEQGKILSYLESDVEVYSGEEAHDLTTTTTSVMDFIEEGRERGENVLVHCRQGRNRAVTTAVCYLITKQNWSFRKAASQVRARRTATLRAHNLKQTTTLANKFFAQQLVARAIAHHGDKSKDAEERYLLSQKVWKKVDAVSGKVTGKYEGWKNSRISTTRNGERTTYTLKYTKKNGLKWGPAVTEKLDRTAEADRMHAP